MAKLPLGLTAKMRVKIGENSFTIRETEFVWIKRLVRIKNGKSEGNII